MMHAFMTCICTASTWLACCSMVVHEQVADSPIDADAIQCACSSAAQELQAHGAAAGQEHPPLGPHHLRAGVEVLAPQDR
eukprot:924849-Pelagomonas_calceolata.AAC.1